MIMKHATRARAVALIVGIAVLAFLVGVNPGGAGAQAPVTLNVYISGDTNIFDLWQKMLLPAFQKRYPQYKANMVPLLHGEGSQGVFDKILAAKQSGRQTDVDLWETQPSFVTQGIPDALWVKLGSNLIPNLSHVLQQKLDATQSYSMPYRGSSVVVAYNSAFVKTPPKTFDDLVAWIKANPGKFTYCDPNTGGSGQAFMVAAVYKYASDAQFIGSSYDPKAESSWDAAWQLLKSLEPAMYNGGAHPNGNVAVLQLLAQQNIYIAPVWSDMGTDYLSRGLLPKTVKLEQLSPPLFGGDSTVTAPASSAHLEGTFLLLNWLLTPDAQTLVVNGVSGYPGVDWQYMPASVRSKFADVAKPYAPLPNSQYFADMLRLWHERVAGGG